MKIRVATYNIHKGVSSVRGLPRVHALKQAIALFNADVVFLQEVQGKHDRNAARYGAEKNGHKHWPEASQHEFFAGAEHHSAYGMNAVYDHGHHGNALLSKFPIASQTNHDVSDHAYEQRGILHCVLKTPQADVHCYVVHLGLFESGRGRQTQALIDAVMESAPDGEPVIIAGDFNDWRNRAGNQLAASLDLREVFCNDQSMPPARSFPAAMPMFRLDRIYVRGFTVKQAEMHFGAPWSKISDHAALSAQLLLDIGGKSR